jgi:hypothetical protein
MNLADGLSEWNAQVVLLCQATGLGTPFSDSSIPLHYTLQLRCYMLLHYIGIIRDIGLRSLC